MTRALHCPIPMLSGYSLLFHGAPDNPPRMRDLVAYPRRSDVMLQASSRGRPYAGTFLTDGSVFHFVSTRCRQAVDEAMHVSAARNLTGIKDAFLGAALRSGRMSSPFQGKSPSIRRSEDSLHAQHQLIAFGHVLGADLMVSVDEVEQLVLVHYESGPIGPMCSLESGNRRPLTRASVICFSTSRCVSH
jgi:hypothetical protein